MRRDPWRPRVWQVRLTGDEPAVTGRPLGAAAMVIAVAGVLVLAMNGGSACYARPLFESAVVAATVIAALSLPAGRPVPYWLGWGLLPALGLCAIQVLPLGWHHAWSDADAAALSIGTPDWWSLDRERTFTAIPWLCALFCAGLVIQAHYHQRAAALGDLLVAIVSVDAGLGLLLCLSRIRLHDAPTLGASATFIYHNQAAAFWAAALPLALVRVRRAWWSWWTVAAITLFLAVVVSLSRGGILVATIIGVPFWWLLMPKQRGLILGVGATVCLFLVIGMGAIEDRFASLVSQGDTLNERTRVWAGAMPLIAHAGFLGVGANATETVYGRSGTWFYFPTIVNHLHSDVLEWPLEFGWAGASVIAIGLGVAVWLLRPAADQRRVNTDAVAALLGLLGLALHSCADFLWNREAIALEAVVLGIIAACARAHALPAARRPRARMAAMWPRALLLVLAAALLGLLPRTWTQERDRDEADWIRAAIDDNRSGARLERAQVAAIFARTPTTAALAEAQASLALGVPATVRLVDDPITLAARALGEAAAITPVSPQAWILRAQLAQCRFPPDDAAFRLAAARILALCPTRSNALDVILPKVCASDAAPLPGIAPALRAALRLDAPREAAFFPYAERVLGTAETARILTTEGYPNLLYSGLDWLSQRDGDDAAVTMLQAIGRLHDRLYAGPPAPLQLWPTQEILRPMLSRMDAPVTTVMPAHADQRHETIAGLSDAMLPIPPALVAAVAADPPPWSRWKTTVDFSDPAVRRELEPQLAAITYHTWARRLFAQMMIADHAVGGGTLDVTDEFPADFLQELLTLPTIPEGAERLRLKGAFATYRMPHWHLIDNGGRWTWFLATDTPRTILVTRIWVGFLVDGTWKGWVKGTVTSAGVPPGLHHLAIVLPPLPGITPP